MGTKLTDDETDRVIRRAIWRNITISPSNLPDKGNTELTQNSVIIGDDLDTGGPFFLYDIERCGGTYFLGEPRTGKSNLLISVALQDSDRGHGVLFIDPHTDAIKHLLARLPQKRLQDVILLDPTNAEYAFGINPLYCANPKDLDERQLCFGQAEALFLKVFGKEDEKLGIWLSKYLGNCLYPLIENQGYTLYDIALFLRERSFRESLLKNVKFHTEVVEFWHDEFERMPPKYQMEEIRPLLTRIETLRRNPYIKHIISQPKSTIDFAEVMQSKKIVLLRIPSWQDDESKSFIGTLIISQLLKVVFLRSEISEHLRTPFAIFCDEFQNFTTPDFAKLFTQTGKYNVMPAVAHQVRLGQLKPDDPNRGATLAAPIKVFFRLSVPDAKELAPVTAKSPPIENRLEPRPEVIISQEPVSHLLSIGSTNSKIQNFVNKYLRPLQDCMEDIKEGMEGERLLRDKNRDIAALSRARVQTEALTVGTAYPKQLTSQYESMFAALVWAENALAQALGQDIKLLSLHESSKELRLSRRSLDRFLTAIMEGRIKQGQEAFSAFLTCLVRVRAFALVPESHARVLDLYIDLMYGDPKTPRTIPFAFAQTHGLFLETLTEIQKRVEEKDREDKQNYLNKCLAEKYELYKQFREFRQGVKQAKAECVWQEVTHGKVWLNFNIMRMYDNTIKELIGMYITLLEYPKVQELFKPYYTARFTPTWRDKLKITIEENLYSLQRYRQVNAEARDFLRKQKWFWSRSEDLPYKNFYSKMHYQDSLLDAFQQFLEQYGEGALVVLILMRFAEHVRFDYDYKFGKSLYLKPYEWYPQPFYNLARSYLNTYTHILPKIWGARGNNGLYEQYLGYNMLYVPAIEDREPLEILITLQRLAEITSGVNYMVDFAKYFWHAGDAVPYKVLKVFEDYYDEVKDRDNLVVLIWSKETINKVLEKREDLQILWKEAWQKRSWHWQKIIEGKYHWSANIEKLVRMYLERRACDIARYGQKTADLTFPQPTIEGATSRQIADLVASLVTLLQEHSQLNEKQEDEKVLANLKARAQRELDDKFSKQIIPMPDIQLRSLTYSENEELISACLKELRRGGWNAQATLNVIKDFVEFCDLLSKPENHLQKPCMQYIIKEVNTRSYLDMTNEMEQELMKLDPDTAYVRLIRNEEGVHVRKIKTRKLSKVDDVDVRYETVRAQIWESNIKAGYYKERRLIDEEIRQRQEKWRRQISDSIRQTPPSVEPPPTYY